MKKMFKYIVLVGLVILPLSADYELTIINKDGTEIRECIKSYSFSNNVESLSRKNSVGVKDIYSQEETLTNKVFLGKPVYRKVILIESTVRSKTSIDTGIDLSYINRIVSIEDLVVDKLIYEFTSNYSQFWIDKNSRNLYYYHNSSSGHNGIQLILEYTKTTDIAEISPSNNFKSYIHYVLSSASNNKVTTKDLKDIGVRFEDGFTYDNQSLSCTKNK